MGAFGVVVDQPGVEIGLRPIRGAHPGAEPVVLGKIPETFVEPVQARAIGITIDQHRLHFVEQDRVRHAAERVEEPLMRFDQGVEPLVVGKPDERQPAEAERADEGRQLVPAAPDRRPVHLRLSPRRRLEPDDLRGRQRRILFGEPVLQDRNPAGIPPARSSRRYPSRATGGARPPRASSSNRTWTGPASTRAAPAVRRSAPDLARADTFVPSPG